MLPNQTMVAPDGYEVALFPLQNLRVTQGYGPSTYSHCCGAPMDFGKTTTQTPLYAPFSMHRTYYYNTGGHGRMYASDNPVWTPSHGLTYVSILVVHDNNPPTQTSFRQGELFAHTGTAGNVSEHVHIETAVGQQSRQITSSVTCRGVSHRCDYIEDFAPPNTLLYVNDTNIVNGGGYSWYEYQGGQPSPTPTPGYNRDRLSLYKLWLSTNRFNGRIKL